MAPNVRETVEAAARRPLVVGHRGAAGQAPENTAAAFRSGLASGAVALECDVWISADGVPVVMHDESPARTFPAFPGPVSAYSAAEMSQAGIPTLADFLDLVRGQALAVVEIKGGENVVPRTLDTVRAAGMLDSTVLFSFGAAYLAQAKALEPSVFAVLLQGDAEGLPSRAAAFDAVGLHYASVTEDVFRLGKPIFAWTVPPGPEVIRLQRLGTNFIITDHPSAVIAQLA